MIKTFMQLIQRFQLATSAQPQLPAPSTETYHVSDIVYFGGIYEKEAGLISEDGQAPASTKDVKIDFYVKVNDTLVPLPGIVFDPRLIQKFSDMQRGQPFVITKESSWGGMGTRIHGIKLSNAPNLMLGSQQLVEREVLPALE